MKTIKNCAWVIARVFRYAPGCVILTLFFEISVALFRPFQMVITERLVDSANNYFYGSADIRGLVIWGAALVTVLTLWVTFQKIENFVIRVLIKKRLATRFASDVLDKLGRLPYRYFEDEGSNDLFERISKDPAKTLEDCYYRLLVVLFSIVSIAATLALIIAYSVWIGIGLVIITIPMALLINGAAAAEQDAWENGTSLRRRETDLKNLLADKHAVYEMNVFGSGEYIENKWFGYQTRLYSMIKRAAVKICCMDGLYTLLDVLYTVFVGVLSVVSLLNGAFTLGRFSALLSGMHTISQKLNTSSGHFSELISLAARCGFLIEFFRLPQKPVSTEEPEVSADIILSHVCFTYPNTDREILHDVSLTIRRGERVAFVGENGSGKSTLIKLICGLYQPSHGRIIVGGHDISTLSESSRRALLSVLFQDFQSYSMSLRENTAIGNVDKLNDNDAIISALSDAGAADIAEKHGLDAQLGKLRPDGTDLSRGQWQRVAMSRAFISNSEFTALDEPTAALDPIAESRMYESFSEILHERGAIMISHRLASAKMADRIFVLDGGRIVEEGSHNELMQNGGLYAGMYELQSSWYTEKEDA